MQLKLYRYLTWGSLGMAIILVCTAIYMFFNHDITTGISAPFVIYVIFAFVLIIVYKFLENNLDKLLLQNKAFNGEVVLANIKSSSYITAFRDSGFRTYVLMRLEVTYYDQDLQQHSASIVEKMNKDCIKIPQGTVYMTYDSKNPDNGMIIQNVMISRIPELMPLVKKYENAKNINIKYLDVHYDKGLVIQTFQEALKQQQENSEENENSNA